MTGHQLEPLAVVEDNDEDFEALCRALRDRTSRDSIVRFESGEQALDRLAGAPATWPVLLLLDLNLPGRGGLQVLSELKRDPLLRSVPVVIVSGSRRQEDIDAAYRRGANAYLVKPLDFADYHRALVTLYDFWLLIARPTPPRPVPQGPSS